MSDQKWNSVYGGPAEFQVEVETSLTMTKTRPLFNPTLHGLRCLKDKVTTPLNPALIAVVGISTLASALKMSSAFSVLPVTKVSRPFLARSVEPEIP